MTRRPLSRTTLTLSGLVLAGLAAAAPACGARSDLAPLGSEEPAPREGTCGDGIVEGDEQCDDANMRGDDACVGCALARCGDGFLRAGFEACDDGNAEDADACTSRCSLPTCGDGVLEGAEECDDADDDDTDACVSTCLAARCGDGVVQTGVEECDEGASNDDRPAAYLVQGERVQAVRPHPGDTDVVTFYDYRSASAHIGVENAAESHLLLHLEAATGVLSLVTVHGIDLDDGGVSQGRGRVFQSFGGLPAGSFVSVADDERAEFDFVDGETVHGLWRFRDNTDGGVISGLPWPGDYVIPMFTQLDRGIATWDFVQPGGERVALAEETDTLLVVQSTRGSCRTDCTIPRCGDGRLDAGEVCDDGNEVGGDGCPPDCLGR